jgi:hypothetical protein
MLIHRAVIIISVIASGTIAVPVPLHAGTGVAHDRVIECIKAIRERPKAILGPMPMPRVCYDFGQGALGGPMTDLFGRLGTPDALSYSKDYLSSENGLWSKGVLEVSYLYPRDLNTLLKKHPTAQAAYHVLNVLAKDGVIRAARVTNFVGLSVGDSKERVYWVIGRPSHADKSGEVLFYDPYPFIVQLDETKRRVVGVSISTTIDYMNELEGPGPFDIRNSAGKIVGIKLLGGPHR